MPDQPDDPIHYDMKIPPEPKDATLHKDEERRGSDEASEASEKLDRSDDQQSKANPPGSANR
ncbi:MAG TPA: hypothetical protein VGL22_05165 [Terracidiphilus sp.]|jgi:hypothetical protein